MRIKAIFFAGVRERIGVGEKPLELPDGATVADAWTAVGGADTGLRILCAVNEEYCDFRQPLNEGDAVAFFPPVTGG